MSRAVFCIARDRAQAEAIVIELKAAGFSNQDISALLPDRSETRDFAHERHTKAPEAAVAGGSTGALIGGTLGWLVGAGSLAIPGLGLFVAAGPIMAALSGAALGAAAGGVTGTLVGLGMPEYEAKLYEGKLRKGGVLISVHADDSEDRRRVKEIFTRAGAEDISTAPEKDADR